MNKYKVYIEGYEVGFKNDTLGTREKIIRLVSGETISIDENFIYKSIEPEKVKIPQFVADWIEYFKKCSGTLYGSTAPYSYYGRAITDDFEGDVTEVLRWIRDNSEVYARAWLDGYEVEEEKRYLVTLKNGQPLVKSQSGSILYFSQNVTAGNYKVTQKELEDANFGWVFDCPGIEIEEVEE